MFFLERGLILSSMWWPGLYFFAIVSSRATRALLLFFLFNGRWDLQVTRLAGPLFLQATAIFFFGLAFFFSYRFFSSLIVGRSGKALAQLFLSIVGRTSLGLGPRGFLVRLGRSVSLRQTSLRGSFWEPPKLWLPRNLPP